MVARAILSLPWQDQQDMPDEAARLEAHEHRDAPVDPKPARWKRWLGHRPGHVITPRFAGSSPKFRVGRRGTRSRASSSAHPVRD